MRSYELYYDVRTTHRVVVTEEELAELVNVDPAKIAERLRESGALAAGLKGDLRPAVDPLDKLTDVAVNGRLDDRSEFTEEVVENVEVHLAS